MLVLLTLVSRGTHRASELFFCCACLRHLGVQVALAMAHGLDLPLASASIVIQPMAQAIFVHPWIINGPGMVCLCLIAGWPFCMAGRGELRTQRSCFILPCLYAKTPIQFQFQFVSLAFPDLDLMIQTHFFHLTVSNETLDLDPLGFR